MQRFDILVTYDVAITTKAGLRRLRKVATVCQNYGQRVQLSVFECRVTLAQLEQLESELLSIIDPKNDSLRIYVLYGGRNRSLRAHGLDRYVDFDEPMVL
ncbi:CRISPR-associated endonuclease Cas2 [Thermomicrobiaceae bacterium CFH 74404]|uniref:CRISPR-associated endoribonuclease Cas2 n=1 Tax=Thermalbibacter longus TaxID=2951981 RepID=A0AA42BAL0_9BACT|nr:CRISPR-associated endonuclease Cas2 [Thermalbibacter longus]MCM8748665.1 CRISPR-associated endonuclease Cas2 [Thermalbibacter longus]